MRMKWIFRVLFVVFAAAALGGWADRRGLMQPVWDKVMPATSIAAQE